MNSTLNSGAQTLLERDIESIAMDLLDSCGIRRPPTRLQLLDSHLGITAIEYQLDSTDTFSRRLRALRAPLRDQLLRAYALLRRLRPWGIIRGNIVGLERAQHQHHLVWTRYHEVAHRAIPWHKELLDFADSTQLSPALNQQLDDEADYCASILLFQGPRFLQYAKQVPFNFAGARKLSRRFGCSLTAACRQLVSTTSNHSVLLCANTSHPTARRLLTQMANSTLSPQFAASYPAILPETLLAMCLDHIRLLNHGYRPDGNFLLRDDSGEWRTFALHHMHTGYELLILLHERNASLR